MAHQLPPLPYAYDALEPYISEQIMTLHHTKHHQTYVNPLNPAEKAYAAASTPKERIALHAAIKFNGGGDRDHLYLHSNLLISVKSGHINHSLFWKNLAPSTEKGGHGGVLKDGPLKKAICAN